MEVSYDYLTNINWHHESSVGSEEPRRMVGALPNPCDGSRARTQPLVARDVDRCEQAKWYPGTQFTQFASGTGSMRLGAEEGCVGKILTRRRLVKKRVPIAATRIADSRNQSGNICYPRPEEPSQEACKPYKP